MAKLSQNPSLDLYSVSAATIYNSVSLGTTPVRMPGFTASSTLIGLRQAIMTSKATTAFVAWLLTDATSPTFVASIDGTVAATDGVQLRPLSSRELAFPSSLNLWLVASAATTPVQVALFDSVVK